MHDQDTYVFGAADDRPYETALPGYGRTFPHAYGNRDNGFFTTLLTLSPAGDEMTLEFAKTLIDNEDIGDDAVTDYLSISFSSTDYVGHIFGPSSLEAEDNILRLDRTLADLFAYVDAEIGLDNVVIVLSADHGGPEAPGYLAELGIEADYIHPDTFDRASVIARLKERFGIGEALISTYFHPYLYLNRKAIAENDLDQQVVERAVAGELMKLDGVALAVPSSALQAGEVPRTPITDAVLRNFNPRRSGDIYLVFDPNRFINDFDGLTVAASHGSPWRYDTFVPIIFAGKGITPQLISRLVHTTAIAPTLSQIVGAKPPTGSTGDVLFEALPK